MESVWTLCASHNSNPVPFYDHKPSREHVREGLRGNAAFYASQVKPARQN